MCFGSLVVMCCLLFCFVGWAVSSVCLMCSKLTVWCFLLELCFQFWLECLFCWVWFIKLLIHPKKKKRVADNLVHRDFFFTWDWDRPYIPRRLWEMEGYGRWCRALPAFRPLPSILDVHPLKVFWGKLHAHARCDRCHSTIAFFNASSVGGCMVHGVLGFWESHFREVYGRPVWVMLWETVWSFLLWNVDVA
jgi:hypothetical protein